MAYWVRGFKDIWRILAIECLRGAVGAHSYQALKIPALVLVGDEPIGIWSGVRGG